MFPLLYVVPSQNLIFREQPKKKKKDSRRDAESPNCRDMSWENTPKMTPTKIKAHMHIFGRYKHT